MRLAINSITPPDETPPGRSVSQGDNVGYGWQRRGPEPL